jgi:hypothetical protein
LAYVELVVEREWIDCAVRWACRRAAHTIDRRNMNSRSVTEKLDDISMGEIGAVAAMEYLKARGNRVLAYDDIRTDGFFDPDPGWDLAVGAGLERWPAAGDDPRDPPRGHDCRTIQVKSSRIPKADGDDVELAISNRDFKVFKNENSYDIGTDLTADFEAQVYFALERSRFTGVGVVGKESIRREEVDELSRALRLEERYGRCYLVGFASRAQLIGHSRSLAERRERTTWMSRHAGEAKRMWVAPLSLGRLPRG